MKYFEYGLIFFIFAAICVLLVAGFLTRLKILHFYRLAQKAFLKKSSKNNGETYFSSFYLQQAVSRLCKIRTAEARHALVYLCAGRSGPAAKYFKKQKQDFPAAVLSGFKKPEEAVVLLEKLMKKKNTGREVIWAELMPLYSLCKNRSGLQMALERFEEKKASAYARSRYYFFRSQAGMESGDLLSASIDCSAAIKLFRKQKAYFEEAEAHVLMGILYRLSTIADVAQFMFDTAAKIFKSLGFAAGEASAYANLGMLMSMQNRFDEAEDFYLKGFDLNRQNGRKDIGAQITNHRGLNAFLNNQNQTAEQLLKEAYATHKKLKNNAGMAFSREILGNVAFACKDYERCAALAEEAKKLYLQEKNTAAYLESFYLLALALFEQGKAEEAEKALRKIVDTAGKTPSCFHLANAYNLLGLIYLKKNDLRRAKGLFQQSLDLEQVNNRLSAIATDYANIGLVEYRRGNKEQALKTLQTALEYAEANQDDELVAILRQRILDISEA